MTKSDKPTSIKTELQLNRNIMRKTLICLLACVVLYSCQNQKFKVEGHIENASGEMLILEHNGIIRTEAIDSVKIKKDGSYSIKAARPEYPDFYRLRIKNKSITFAIDSTETITIDADFNGFATEYTVENSYASKQIKSLRVSIINIQNKLGTLKDMTDESERKKMTTEIEADIEQHKETARKLIMQNPRSTAAYFALYQQINGRYLFSPFVQEDYPYWASVATAFHAYMPQYDRSKNIYNFVLEALKDRQNAQKQAALNELLNSDMASGYIDIALPDRNGNETRLSDHEGKVVLIDFSAYEAKESIDYTFDLRDLYNKYSKRGFEIYQVSLDRNKLLWEISTENIPWICVRDENGPATQYARLYNVTQLPTTFLLDKDGNITARSLKFDELDKEIEKLLNK